MLQLLKELLELSFLLLERDVIEAFPVDCPEKVFLHLHWCLVAVPVSRENRLVELKGGSWRVVLSLGIVVVAIEHGKVLCIGVVPSQLLRGEPQYFFQELHARQLLLCQLLYRVDAVLPPAGDLLLPRQPLERLVEVGPFHWFLPLACIQILKCFLKVFKH